MIKWDKNNPLHREIMDDAAHAWREQQMAELQAKMDAAYALMPWWMRLYARLLLWSAERVRVFLLWVDKI